MKELQEKPMTDDETLQACCKLMARILFKRANSFNATDIKYCLEGITDKDTNESFGKITVLWEKENV